MPVQMGQMEAVHQPVSRKNAKKMNITCILIAPKNGFSYFTSDAIPRASVIKSLLFRNISATAPCKERNVNNTENNDFFF